MTRINLLPWRELQRKEREREFYTVAGGAAFVMLLVIVYVHFHVSGMIETQNGRNAYLNKEIKKVESQIKDIKQLETEKTQLLARMKVIEELQSQRPLVVHLFDELVKAMPDGVYLTSIAQSGSSISIEGVAQSNARVSAFMRNISDSHWLTDPKLGVIQALDNKKDGQKGSKFALTIKEVVEGEDAATAPAAKAKVKNKAAAKTKTGKRS
jgi:type IV pilus assembly protein PilN